MENDVAPAVSFYTEYLGFKEKPGATNFAIIFRGNLELVLSTNYGPGGAAKPMSDGRKAEPGGWNRIIINVELPARQASGNRIVRIEASPLQDRNAILARINP